MYFMKNIVCPVSDEKIPENLPRVIAFFVTLLFGLYLITGFLAIPILLAFDFFARGFNYISLSPLCHVSKFLLQLTGRPQKLIDKAPKLFAARLGFIFSLLISIFAGLNLRYIPESLSLVMIAFSFLEWAVNTCVGCILFTWLVLPFSRTTN
jgi:hypothetical protein